MAITSWSNSKYTDFAKCKFLCYLKHDKRVPEPVRELRPGQTEHANDRGSRIHDAAEMFVRGKGPAIPEMRKFQAEFDVMQRLFTRGEVSLEGEWGMDQGWNTAPWKGAWLRLKLDSLVHISKTEAVVIDYKSGKRFGNEMKHAEQTQLYALVSALRHPELEIIHTELWYLDVNEIAQTTYTRDQALRFKRAWDMRGNQITSCGTWPPNPNIFSCQWCGYGPWGTNDCKVGVKR